MGFQTPPHRDLKRYVSLVMLPEECRGLSTRRFPVQSLKLKAMASVFGYRFRRRLAATAG